MNAKTKVSWASEVREIAPFSWVQLTPRVEGSRAWLEAPSLNTNGKPLEIDVYSPISWIVPTHIPASPDNQYTLEQLLTDPQNQVAFDEWKKNIDSELQGIKAELEADFQKEFNALATSATEKWYNITDTESMKNFLLNVIVPEFDRSVVYPWTGDLFLIHWTKQEFFEQYGLDYMWAIHPKSTESQINDSATRATRILDPQ